MRNIQRKLNRILPGTFILYWNLVVCSTLPGIQRLNSGADAAVLLLLLSALMVMAVVAVYNMCVYVL